jgi:hypothetical protein
MEISDLTANWELRKVTLKTRENKTEAWFEQQWQSYACSETFNSKIYGMWHQVKANIGTLRVPQLPLSMFKQASKRLERRLTSIVSSALSPSTIAPNELEFCKESSVTKWHWHHCSWKDNEVDRSQWVQKHRWQPQDTWALFSLSNRATCVWASQVTTALQNSASFSSQSLYSNLIGYESEIYLGINNTV